MDPLRKDVGNKSIGGFAQGKGYGNCVPEMERMEQISTRRREKHNDEPNDGKDGGVPGDARELLGLAHQLHTEGGQAFKSNLENEEKNLRVKAMR